MNTSVINTKYGTRINHIVIALTLLCSILYVCGCRPATKSNDKKQTRSRSSAELLVDGITGRHAIEAGKRAKSDIEAISEKQNARLGEVLGE